MPVLSTLVAQHRVGSFNAAGTINTAGTVNTAGTAEAAGAGCVRLDPVGDPVAKPGGQARQQDRPGHEQDDFQALAAGPQVHIMKRRNSENSALNGWAHNGRPDRAPRPGTRQSLRGRGVQSRYPTWIGKTVSELTSGQRPAPRPTRHAGQCA